MHTNWAHLHRHSSAPPYHAHVQQCNTHVWCAACMPGRSMILCVIFQGSGTHPSLCARAKVGVKPAPPYLVECVQALLCPHTIAERERDRHRSWVCTRINTRVCTRMPATIRMTVRTHAHASTPLHARPSGRRTHAKQEFMRPVHYLLCA